MALVANSPLPVMGVSVSRHSGYRCVPVLTGAATVGKMLQPSPASASALHTDDANIKRFSG